ncbi:MAG: tetratricopeptide repeat protein [Acidobacteriota bacterium]
MLFAVLAAVVMSGYVDDSVCGNCHEDRARTYAHVGMARSFTRPRAEVLIEDFEAPPFFHARSGQYFEMRRRGDVLVFRRYQLAADGAPIHVFEQQVDWILGSGNHARTYLYRTPGGELYQLPLSWYTQIGEWRMAPGYDRADHDGVVRRVRHECMFCHNAYPAVAGQALSYWRPQQFPAELPQGIGCQRCHGPGAQHAATRTRETIINPARLGTRLRNDICYECHMQPSVILAGLRRPGRDIYSFRPGQPLAEYSAPLDIEEDGQSPSERFEINHHPYRLEQSRCFTESEGRLSCLTCHDPHRKVTDAAHYRSACMSCHAQAHRASEDCTSCHMQKRRTQDVVHVVMTDHWIRRNPGGPELLAAREEREPSIRSVSAGDPLSRAVALVRATGGAHLPSAQALEAEVMARRPAEVEPWLDLASAQLRQRNWPSLEQTTKEILRRDPKQELALEWAAIARAALSGNRDVAIRALVALSRPEAAFNAGLLLAANGQSAEAIAQYERALTMRPNFAVAWFRLGEARGECGDRAGAIDAFRRALEIDPSLERARSSIVQALRATGNAAEAERYLTVASGR